ncbi:hypothetical protein ACU5P1_23560 [Pseudomonas plecoglossicida]|uniref:Uncharacterized protein n=1 Tax=Pseudomonas plecoglossicida TaxID=70775 RepID=A0AAD0R0N8_PSEDL|nr:hypothetical protein [Pseudomonas plecoglossicida]AXM97699.1 hypothetical protein DVB73_18840 [Pseudomonas plecoglossicida]EPB95719.1 hypothetical protein L321_11650 [Pseudomonas plecoglossicida NB2011]QLB57531.1 hypothetical protein HAV28_23330 [Pseudomonas plecoglossicida]
MSNDFDVVPFDGGNEIQPYDPGLPILAPLSPTPDAWGRDDVLTPQEIANYQSQSGPTLFGAALPPGTTAQQINAILGELGGVYMADMAKLGYPSHLVQGAIAFITANAAKAPTKVRRQHSFKLPIDQAGDWLAESFGNHLHGLSGTQQQKQQFLDASLQWLALANKKLGATQAQPVGTLAQGSAPRSTEAMLAQLSDADYNKVVKINEQALANTMQVLQRKWGEFTYLQNIAIAQRYLDSLPAKDQAYFDQFTNVNGVDWVHLRNSAEFISAIFDAATGAHNIPSDGAGIAREIAECEKCMRENRKQWLSDSALQARYRTLLDLQKKG